MRIRARELPPRIDPGGKMGNNGPVACDRCGERIEQPATGRRRLYCGRNCRELAYRARSKDQAVRDALKAHGVDVDSVSSVVERRPVPVTSVVETRAAVPKARRRRSGMTGSAMPLPDIM
jgi:hypothetical protein